MLTMAISDVEILADHFFTIFKKKYSPDGINVCGSKRRSLGLNVGVRS